MLMHVQDKTQVASTLKEYIVEGLELKILQLWNKKQIYDKQSLYYKQFHSLP